MNDSIVWQNENEIVVPVAYTEPQGATPRAATEKPVAMRPRNVMSTLAADSLASRAAEQDTITPGVPGEIMQGIILVDPNPLPEPSPNLPADKGVAWDAMSWIYLAIVVLFCTIALKFKGNSRYLKALISDLTDTRLRHNVFDETVRETSWIVLLNLMWSIDAGILLWGLVRLTAPEVPAVATSTIANPGGILVCTAVAATYIVTMLIAYWMVGNVFSDRQRTQLWVKGAAASTALETFLLFPLSILMLIYPNWSVTLLIIGAVVLVTGKIVFLYKGFRIFFTEISSWLIFLYYLCSLEIVPLILTYIGSVAACSSLL